jgi:carboxyl-terminal processing protease
VLATREAKGAEKQTINAAAGDGSVSLPAVVLIDTGTSGAAELFAASVSGNKRADLIGERTIGRAAIQRLIKLPDGSGLWLSTARYLTPAGVPLHGKGLEPTVAVDEPDVEFGQPAPTTDPALDKALERLAVKAAA